MYYFLPLGILRCCLFSKKALDFSIIYFLVMIVDQVKNIGPLELNYLILFTSIWLMFLA